MPCDGPIGAGPPISLAATVRSAWTAAAPDLPCIDLAREVPFTSQPVDDVQHGAVVELLENVTRP